MRRPRMEFGEVRMAFTNGGRDERRAENISRLTFAHVERLMDGRLRRLGADVEIGHLRVGPVGVSFETMSDEAIARAGAAEIYRALLREL